MFRRFDATVQLHVIAVCLVCVASNRLSAQGLGDAFHRIENSALGTEHVKESLGALRTCIELACARIAPSLIDDVGNAVETRLHELESQVEKNYTLRYRSEFLARRICELSEEVLGLLDRSIPTNENDRATANRQFRDVLARMDAKEDEHVNRDVWVMATGPVRVQLNHMQTDIFRPGYGQMMTDDEIAELNAIIDSIVAQVQALSTKIGNDGLPPNYIREVATIARQGHVSIVEFVGRHASLEPKSSDELLRPVRQQLEGLKELIDQSLVQAQEEEISTILTNAQERAEKARRDNDPKAIEAATLERARKDAAAQLASNGRSGGWAIIGNVLLVAILLFLIVKRRFQSK
jgi:hypothetical protein